VGGVPEDAFFTQVERVDVLMIPVGGTYTIDAEQAVAVIDRLRPNITIPMHYKTTKLKLQIAPVHGFVKLVKKEYDIAHLGANSFEITAGNPKKRGRVLLMENSY
jgi:L-ascorbate metabolism protein UlaG (beta-lactamase superfamily)